MTNTFFYLYDTEKGTYVEIKGYDEYLRYFRTELLPNGLGTRYMYCHNTKSTQRYYYRIVTEKPGYIGYVRNRLAPNRDVAK